MPNSDSQYNSINSEGRQVAQLQKMLEQLSEISQALSTEKDLQRLLKRIMDAAVQLTNSDAGSLYLVVDSMTQLLSPIENGCAVNRELQFVYAKNFSVEIDFETFYTPILQESYNGYAILSGQAVRIHDAYQAKEQLPYRHNRSFDNKTGYESHSILTLPMKNHQNAIIGALQLINKKKSIDKKLVFHRTDSQELNIIHRSETANHDEVQHNQAEGHDQINATESINDSIIPFSDEDELLMIAFASQAAVAIENSQLYQKQEQMLNEQMVLNDTLTGLNEQLVNLSKKILTAHDDERKRMARDIHDGPAQTVVNLNLKAEITKKYLEKGDIESALKQMNILQSQVHEASKDIRNIIYNLKPSWLDEGLFKAVSSRAKVFEETSGVHTSIEYDGDDQILPQYMTNAIFNMIQEALTNISKYAEATKVSIQIKVALSALHVEVIDNGKGFDFGTVTEKIQNRNAGSGFGLEGMRERISLLRGNLNISSALGCGTRIMVDIPL